MAFEPHSGQHLCSNLPPQHAVFLQRAMAVLQQDDRLVGVAIGGSFISGMVDEFSDIDLVLAVDPPFVTSVMDQRCAIAAGLGTLLASFTAEHVGEPRLLICLYTGGPADSPLHVDLKFVALPEVTERVEDPIVLWEREGLLTAVLRRGQAHFPAPDLEWIEARFWIWIHYAAVKAGRGEWFEAIAMLGFLRERVLGPMALLEAGARPSGVRRLETATPLRAREIEATVCPYDAAMCLKSLYATVDLYRVLRQAVSQHTTSYNEAAERASMMYLDTISHRISAGEKKTRTST